MTEAGQKQKNRYGALGFFGLGAFARPSGSLCRRLGAILHFRIQRLLNTPEKLSAIDFESLADLIERGHRNTALPALHKRNIAAGKTTEIS